MACQLFRAECFFSVHSFFCFNDSATTDLYTLSLHDALPILPSPLKSSSSGRHSIHTARGASRNVMIPSKSKTALGTSQRDRKSTRLNSSHGSISYAVFCLKKKKIKTETHQT